ncbi:hypothetical protein KUCAC02_018702, partial [Chaenocephalus aceratus]
ASSPEEIGLHLLGSEHIMLSPATGNEDTWLRLIKRAGLFSSQSGQFPALINAAPSTWKSKPFAEDPRLFPHNALRCTPASLKPLVWGHSQ